MDSVATVLGRRIRRLRERKGWNQTELAQQVLSNKTTISDIERGEQVPSAVQVGQLEAVLDADGVLQELYDLLSIGIQESAVVADLEHGALTLSMWEWRIPALLQTPDYMRAHMSTAVPTDRLERELAIRRGRQKILRTLVSGWFILDESALRRVYGGPAVMKDQLAHLDGVAAWPNIVIQVMPYKSTRHPGGDGPLTVIEYRDRPGIWVTEGPRSGRMSDDRAEVARSVHDLNLIRAAALPPGESVDFIRNIRETHDE
jgi:transcriptional regulator with XRE-family HTH domain